MIYKKLSYHIWGYVSSIQVDIYIKLFISHSYEEERKNQPQRNCCCCWRLFNTNNLIIHGVWVVTLTGSHGWEWHQSRKCYCGAALNNYSFLLVRHADLACLCRQSVSVSHWLGHLMLWRFDITSLFLLKLSASACRETRRLGDRGLQEWREY